MRILLHICCAPCACLPLQMLRNEGFTVTGCFYNPNIHPFSEYKKRLDCVQQWAATENLPLLLGDDYDLVPWLRQTHGQEEKRCQFCYSQRMDRAAALAAAHNMEGFTTSLLYSVRQQHDLLYTKAKEAAAGRRLQFFYRDYRPFWQEGIKLSRQMNLYRQNYCGCIYSEAERFGKFFMPGLKSVPSAFAKNLTDNEVST